MCTNGKVINGAFHPPTRTMMSAYFSSLSEAVFGSAIMSVALAISYISWYCFDAMVTDNIPPFFDMNVFNVFSSIKPDVRQISVITPAANRFNPKLLNISNRYDGVVCQVPEAGAKLGASGSPVFLAADAALPAPCQLYCSKVPIPAVNFRSKPGKVV